MYTTVVRLKTSDVTTPESQIAASTSGDANPHFISTVQPYTLRFPVLYLPMAFAKSNGFLNKRELILVDEKQRLWSVCLGRIGNTHFGIKRGWPQFRLANGVQVGDTYKFELTNNDTVPIVHFHSFVGLLRFDAQHQPALNISIGFLKYLKRHEYIEHAILKKAGKKWQMKVNDRRFEAGAEPQ
ncbi:hypothetical protein BC332_32198 [Capsicum chinense]|nr:hypothetical protein BC332_32198 [Capsicum chinense]